MYERYLRIRSTATRLEALRHPRKATRGLLGDPAEMAAGVPKITSPMLVVVGGLDRLVPWAEHLHRLVPGSEYHSSRRPHNVYYEAAAAYNARLDEFLVKVG